MIVSAIVLLLIFLPIAATLILSIDQVQNRIIQRASQFASEKLESKVSIGHINIDLLSRVHLHDFYVEDPECDTLLFVDEAVAHISSLNIKRDGLLLSDVEVKGAEFNLNEMSSGELNIRPIVRRLTKQGQKSDFRLHIDHIHAKNSRFRYERLEHRNPEYGIDYYDMDINNIECCLKDFQVLTGGVVSSTIEDLYAKERSGFELIDLSGYFKVDRGVISFENLRARTELSEVYVPAFVIDGENWDEYKEYIDKVDMHGRVEDSTLSTYDLGFFSPGVRDWDLELYSVDGSFDGVVRDFNAVVKQAKLGDATTVEADVHIIGIPEWQTSEYVIGVKKMHTTSSDIELLTQSVTGKALNARALDIIRNLRSFDLRGTFGGKLYSFRTTGNLTTPEGNLSADVRMRREANNQHKLSGMVDTDNLHLGNILNISKLGRLDSHIVADGLVGGGVVADVDVKVGSLGFGRQLFRDINAVGTIDHDTYLANVRSQDEMLSFDLSALVDLGSTIPSYEVMLDLERADLHKLGINKRDSLSVASLEMGLDVDGRKLDDMGGTISVANMRYEYPGGELLSDRLNAEIRGYDDRKDISLKSDFVDIDFQSRASYKDIANYIYNALKRYVPLLYDSDTQSVVDSGVEAVPGYDYSMFTMQTHEGLNDLLAAINGDILVAPDTDLSLVFSPQNNHLALQLGSEALEYKGVILADAQVDVKNNNDSLLMWVNSEAVYLGSRKIMPNFHVNGAAHQNKINLSADFKDKDNEQSGLVAMSAQFSRNARTRNRSMHIDISPSHFTTKNNQWKLYAGGVDIDSSRISINQLHVTRLEQRLVIDGVASRNRGDSIRLTLDNFDLSPFSAFISKFGYDISALSNGYATVRSALHNPQIDARIDLSQIDVNGIEAPPQLITSNWDFEKNRARVIIRDANSRDTVIRGYYQPQGNRYYAKANLKGVKMELLQPFLTDIVSDIKGEASAEATILGEGRSASLNGYATIDSLDVNVDYLSTRYCAPSGRVDIVNNHFIADKITVYDSEGNRGSYSMDIGLDHLSNITYNIDITAKDMLVLDTEAKDNDLFYGHVYASGRASFRGDKRGMKMDVEGTSSDNSKFYMPLSGKEDVSYADFVKFTEPLVEGVDTSRFITRRMMAYERKNRQMSSSTGMMDMDISLNILPNIEVQLVIDPTVGDIIKGKGSGQISMHIVPKANVFEMGGDFTISEGTYLFTLQNVINKLFTVEPGSSIQWSGDPLGAELNIDAVYSTKASLKPLLGNSIQGVDIARAVPVNCYIKLTGELMSPEVSFDVDVTNVAPEIQTIVKSALNDQQAIATQMFWLLAANTFSAEDTGAMGASLSATTGFELLSNQLSNWLSGDNYNIILRYRPRTELTGDEVDFGFSKSWFNNRLIVEVEGGYLSDASRQASQNASNFVAEGFITWLIDPDGAFRLKGFTQTIDRYGENQGLQESGVGVYYAESFNTFKELGRSIRRRFTNPERQQKRKERREAKQGVGQDSVKLDTMEHD